MSASAVIADRCYDRPSAGGLALRVLNVLLGTGALLFGACTRLRGSGTGTAAARLSSPKSDGGASPLAFARRSRLAAQRFCNEPS